MYLDEDAVAKLCRQQGIYPHHLTQWKADFASGKSVGNLAEKQADTKADVVLGLFLPDKPEKWDMVKLGENKQIVDIVIKQPPAGPSSE